MKVLVLDRGSSSVKFQLVATDEPSAPSGKGRALARDAFRIVSGRPTS